MDVGEARPVRLGVLVDGGLAPAILAVVERGIQHRPALARSLEAEVELDMEEGETPVRIVFARDHVLVEDGPAAAPDLRIAGTMSDLASLMVAPLVAAINKTFMATKRKPDPSLVRLFANTILSSLPRAQ